MKKIVTSLLVFAILFTAMLPVDAAIYAGVDVYRGQSDNAPINWPLMAKTKQFAYIKASENIGYKDSAFDTNVSGIKKTAMRWGPYHFLRVYSPASCKSQADYYWSVIKGTGYTLIPAVDCESYDGQKYSYNVRACIRVFVDEFYRLSGIKPVIYTYTSFALENDLPGYFKDCKLWQSDIRGYAQNINWKWAAWQYSWTGQLAAVKGRNVDLDYATSDIFMPGVVKVDTRTYPVKAMPHAWNAYLTKAQTLRTIQGAALKRYTVPTGCKVDVESIDDDTQLLEVVYPVGKAYEHGYIRNEHISWRWLNRWRNGCTAEAVYTESGTQKGWLFAYEYATPLFNTGKGYVVLYNAGSQRRTGIVKYGGGFSF